MLNTVFSIFNKWERLVIVALVLWAGILGMSIHFKDKSILKLETENQKLTVEYTVYAKEIANAQTQFEFKAVEIDNEATSRVGYIKEFKGGSDGCKSANDMLNNFNY